MFPSKNKNETSLQSHDFVGLVRKKVAEIFYKLKYNFCKDFHDKGSWKWHIFSLESLFWNYLNATSEKSVLQLSYYILGFICMLIGTTFTMFQGISVVVIYAMLHTGNAEKSHAWKFL